MYDGTLHGRQFQRKLLFMLISCFLASFGASGQNGAVEPAAGI